MQLRPSLKHIIRSLCKYLQKEKTIDSTIRLPQKPQKKEAKNLCINLPDISHRIHGTGVFTYIWWIFKFMLNVGKYCGYMEHLGSWRRNDPTRFSSPKIPLNSLLFIHLWGNRTLRPWCLAMHSSRRRKQNRSEWRKGYDLRVWPMKFISNSLKILGDSTNTSNLNGEDSTWVQLYRCMWTLTEESFLKNSRKVGSSSVKIIRDGSRFWGSFGYTKHVYAKLYPFLGGLWGKKPQFPENNLSFLWPGKTCESCLLVDVFSERLKHPIP